MQTKKLICRTVIYCCCFLFISCSTETVKQKLNEGMKFGKLRFLSIRDKFKYGHLNAFASDTISWDNRPGFYKVVDSVTHFHIFQDTSYQYSEPSEFSTELEFFYSRQKVNSRKLLELTILSQSETDFCDEIRYLIYDLKGKLVSSFKVAGTCGDGGYYEKSHGRFLNDSVYQMFTEDNYKTEDTEQSDIVTFSKMTTTIHRDGTIGQKLEVVRTETAVASRPARFF